MLACSGFDGAGDVAPGDMTEQGALAPARPEGAAD